MHDETFLQFLIGITTYIVNLHHRVHASSSHTGPFHADQAFHDSSIPWEDEGFSRWMGWRGEAAQDEEIRNKRK